MAKYLTRDISVPKGKKRYWASRSLARPEEEYYEMSFVEFGEIYNSARYQKAIETDYGTYLLCEVDGEDLHNTLNKIKILLIVGEINSPKQGPLIIILDIRYTEGRVSQ
mgnify:CR=1 FL=1